MDGEQDEFTYLYDQAMTHNQPKDSTPDPSAWHHYSSWIGHDSINALSSASSCEPTRPLSQGATSPLAPSNHEMSSFAMAMNSDAVAQDQFRFDDRLNSEAMGQGETDW